MRVDFLCVRKRVEEGKTEAGQRFGPGAFEDVVRVKFAMRCFFIIGVVFMSMLIMCMIFMPVFIISVVVVGVVVMPVIVVAMVFMRMIFVIMFMAVIIMMPALVRPPQRCGGRYQLAGCRLRQDHNVLRRLKCLDARLNSRHVFNARRLILKADNIRTGREKGQFQGSAVDRDLDL